MFDVRNNSLQVISIYLNGQNYVYWSYVMKFFDRKDMWSYIDEIFVKPTNKNDEAKYTKYLKHIGC